MIITTMSSLRSPFPIFFSKADNNEFYLKNICRLFVIVDQKKYNGKRENIEYKNTPIFMQMMINLKQFGEKAGE